MSKGVEGKKDQ